jgi:hypothetical protein
MEYKIETMLIKKLVVNEMASKIYSKPRNYEGIKKSIKENGIIEALYVDRSNNRIISGNLRFQIAKELKMKTVPVILVDLNENQNINDLLLLSNTQREKSLQDKYNENEYINGLFNLGQGARTDLSAKLQKDKELKIEMKSIFTNSELEYFGKINNLAKDIYGEDNYKDKIFEGLKRIDDGEITRNGYKTILQEIKKDILPINNTLNKSVSIPTYINKEKAITEIQKILSKVPVDLHKEILRHFLNNPYAMAS